jgi:hypothetical protein
VNRPRFVNFDRTRDVIACVMAAALLLCAWRPATTPVANAAAPPRLHGAYKLTFVALQGAGAGTAVVNPKWLKIDGNITDARGNKIAFSAPKLDLDRSTYRFTGTATVGGSPAKISGRLDPDDRHLKRCRISASYLAVDGSAGRVVGLLEK